MAKKKSPSKKSKPPSENETPFISPENLTFATRDDLKELLNNLKVVEYQSSSSKAVDDQIDESKKKIRELEGQITELSKKSSEELTEKSAKVETLEAKLQKRDSEVTELRRRQELLHLLDRVHHDAHEIVLKSEELRGQFESETLFPAYVMSIDIRRSTELMLKAKTPDDFARFISTICKDLRGTILEHYGVFDKFTGDGILAFFPPFFSGEDAGYLALSAAQKCHELFDEHYRTHRSCFRSVILDIGLGIGINLGEVKFVRIGGELTVVGTPVVYACRLGGAPAGHTLLNQPARDELFDMYSAYSTITETKIDMKHEGTILAYDARLNEKQYDITAPDWYAERKKIEEDYLNVLLKTAADFLKRDYKEPD